MNLRHTREGDNSMAKGENRWRARKEKGKRVVEERHETEGIAKKTGTVIHVSCAALHHPVFTSSWSTTVSDKCVCVCVNPLYCVYSLRKWCQGLDRDTDKDRRDGVVNHTHTHTTHSSTLTSTATLHLSWSCCVLFSSSPCYSKLIHICFTANNEEEGEWEEKDGEIWDVRVRREEGLQPVSRREGGTEEWNWERV